jgi:hypothetical protein
MEEIDEIIVCEVDQLLAQQKILQKELYIVCPDLHQLDDTNELEGRYITIKGLVQSGKTKFMITASTKFIFEGYSVVIVLRNNKADQEQIFERLTNFDEQIKRQIKRQFFSICKTSTQKIEMTTDTPRIYLTLGNSSSTFKIMQKIKETNTPYMLFIDEVDFVDSGEGTKKNECIPYLKENAHCVFGVSATVMDPIGKEDVRAGDIILLSAPLGYKGIPSIQAEPITEVSVYTGKTTDNLFKTDKGLAKFVLEFSTRKAFVCANGFVHPQICLVNICRTKEPTMIVQEKLSKKFPSIIIVVYNGNGITYTFRNKKNEFKGTISAFLQMIKDKYQTFISAFSDIQKKEKLPPSIIIFSGDLAGRGISFTSSDFGWHLTSMRLLVASNCDEPELIQRVRLCGIYNDDIPLTLYSTPAILEDIRKAYFRQEEIICFLKNKKHEKFDICCKELIESLDINNEKFTKRSIVKDKTGTDYSFSRINEECGWDIEVYDAKQLPPVQSYTLYGMTPPTEEERKEMIRQHEDDSDEDDSDEDEDEDDEDDINVIVYSSITNQKYITIYDSIVEFLKHQKSKQKWVSRGKIREGCKHTIKDARELGQLQGRYSEIYEGDDSDQRQILWKKEGREYEYCLA